MFCRNRGNELKKSFGRKPMGFVVIEVILMIALVILTLTGCSGKEDPVPPTDEGTTAALPELAPESDEEYEAFLDKLEYLTLGDETEETAANDDSADTADTGESDAVESSAVESNGATIASALSTTDYAKAMDFEWLHDVMESDGSGAGVILDASQVDPIPTDDNSYLNGGWKAYMYGTDSDNGERYLNAVIDAQGEKLNITLNWKYYNLKGTTYEEKDSAAFSGKRDPEDGVVKAKSSSGNLELEKFYISKDQNHEYALGAFQWPSGELCFLGLMR